MRLTLVALVLLAAVGAGCAASWQPAPHGGARATRCGGSVPHGASDDYARPGLAIFCIEAP